MAFGSKRVIDIPGNLGYCGIKWYNNSVECRTFVAQIRLTVDFRKGMDPLKADIDAWRKVIPTIEANHYF